MVTSKFDRSHGKPRTPGKVTHVGGQAYTRGLQDVPQGREVAPRIEPKTVGGPAKATAQTVGHAPDGSGKFSLPSYPNASRSLHGDAVTGGTERTDRDQMVSTRPNRK